VVLNRSPFGSSKRGIGSSTSDCSTEGKEECRLTADGDRVEVKDKDEEENVDVK
jgi:hypothetical protein